MALLRELVESQVRLSHLALNIIQGLPDTTEGRGKFLVEYQEISDMVERDFKTETIT